MNKIITGVLLGMVLGFIDVIPMIIQELSWDVNLSAFFHWIVVGFLVATVDLNINKIFKGLIISIITLIPIAFLVWGNDSSSIMPMTVSTIIFGMVLGYLVGE